MTHDRTALVSARRGERRQPRGHAGVGAGRALPARSVDDPARRERGQRDRDLHPAARDGPDRGRGGDCVGCGGHAWQARPRRVHARWGRTGSAVPSPVGTPFPESAAVALARVTSYGQWRAKPVIPAPVLDRFDATAIRRTVDAILHKGGGWALPDEVLALLTAAGIDSAASRRREGCRGRGASGSRPRLPRRAEGTRPDTAAQDRTEGGLAESSGRHSRPRGPRGLCLPLRR